MSENPMCHWVLVVVIWSMCTLGHFTSGKKRKRRTSIRYWIFMCVCFLYIIFFLSVETMRCRKRRYHRSNWRARKKKIYIYTYKIRKITERNLSLFSLWRLQRLSACNQWVSALVCVCVYLSRWEKKKPTLKIPDYWLFTSLKKQMMKGN